MASTKKLQWKNTRYSKCGRFFHYQVEETGQWYLMDCRVNRFDPVRGCFYTPTYKCVSAAACKAMAEQLAADDCPDVN